jgi:hypothetical protein
MLVLTGKSQETVVIGGADSFASLLKVTVLRIKGGSVVLGSASPPMFPSIVWRCGSESTRAAPGTTTRREPPRNLFRYGTLEARNALRWQSRVRLALR